jgi:hypothetical protein
LETLIAFDDDLIGFGKSGVLRRNEGMAVPFKGDAQRHRPSRR